MPLNEVYFNKGDRCIRTMTLSILRAVHYLSKSLSSVINTLLFAFQLFRKVASALPGMENTPDKKEDLIEVQLKDTPQDQNQQEGGGCAC